MGAAALSGNRQHARRRAAPASSAHPTNAADFIAMDVGAGLSAYAVFGELKSAAAK